MKATSKSQRFSTQVFDRVKARVQELGSQDERNRKYKALCRRSGGTLRVMGLIQFLTFLEAKGQREPQHRDLLDDLRTSCKFLGLPTAAENADFVNKVRKLHLPRYMHMTREVLRLLDWHKRLSEIMIEGHVDDYSEEE